MEYHSNIQKYPAITGVSKSSFANFTISQRLPVILERLIDDLQDNAFVVSRLESLCENIIYGKIEHFPVTGLDIIDWQKYIKPFLGMSWLDVPFYFAETYFYRMILDAVDFFTSGIDPFGG